MALQYRDEFNALRAQMPIGSSKLKPVAKSLIWNGGAPQELAPLAQKVWDVISKRPATISELYRHCSFCELKVYQVVHELLQSKQLATGDQAAAPRSSTPAPASLAPPETSFSQAQVLLPETHAGTNS